MKSIFTLNAQISTNEKPISLDYGKASFSVRHLSNGIYILKINLNGLQVSHHIVVD